MIMVLQGDLISGTPVTTARHACVTEVRKGISLAANNDI